MDDAPVKVLFIMGWGRSGSTLLDNILGEIDGFRSLGELHYLWRRGFIKNHLCGCRRPVEQCELWSRVLDTPFHGGKLGDLDPKEVDNWQHESVRMRYFRRLLEMEPGRPTGWPELDSYIEALGAVLRGVAAVDHARVVVDSSKRPSDGAVLRLVPNLDVYYLHLVRDPRATAYSWRRVKTGPHQSIRQLGPAVYSTLRWMNRNAAAENLARRVDRGRTMFLRYEDFVAQPARNLERILRQLGEEPGPLPFIDERTVSLGVNHTVSGNQRRFKTGPVEIKHDDAWMSEQSRADRALATALSLPRLLRYGYPLRPKPTNTNIQTTPAETPTR